MNVTAYPLSWPEGWPRSDAQFAATFNRKVWNGRYNTTKPVTISDALSRLQRELDLIDADDVTLSCNLIRNIDGSPRSGQAEPQDNGVACYFVLGGKNTALACDKWNRAADNIVAIAKHIEALRGMDRWGVGTMAKAFAGYQALPNPAAASKSGQSWRDILGLTAAHISVADIEAAYRRKAQSAHPDKGGSTEAMAALNRAREEAKAAIG